MFESIRSIMKSWVELTTDVAHQVKWMLKRPQKTYRQGDILFIVDDTFEFNRCKTVPSGIVAEGEVTGHAHRLDTSNSQLIMTEDGQMYVKPESNKGAVITHEEHHTVVLPPLRTYKVEKQTEYDPKIAKREREEIRKQQLEEAERKRREEEARRNARRYVLD